MATDDPTPDETIRAEPTASDTSQPHPTRSDTSEKSPMTPAEQPTRDDASPGRGSSPAPRPAADTKGSRPQSLGPLEMLRWVWTQLTSMRTALALLFLLALGAIPGSLIPQNSTSPMKVSTFKDAHKVLDTLYTPLQMYDVYSSAWFSAIYLLLFASLIGCIIPRIRVYWRAVRGRPPRVPSRLDRLPEHHLATSDATPAASIERAEAWLRSRRFRVERHELADGTLALSAERGYLREFGNLLFHVSLVFLLLGVAWNNLLGFKGSTVLIEGQGFSNVITQYDEYHAGAWVDTDHLEPFSIVLKQFVVKFETGPVQRGAARDFRGTVAVTQDGATTDRSIAVNHPLTIGGDRVHLIGHGYAPHITVKDGKGQVAYAGPVAFLPTDGNFTSTGVIKAPDARPERLSFQAIFLPTAPDTGMMGHSIFPDVWNPKLFLNAWYGAPAKETGLPQNVYQLDTKGMTQFKNGKDVLRFVLKPGEGYTLPDGKGSIEFDGLSRWTKVQVSHAPGLPLALGSISLAVLGLCLSLFIRPRRLWLKARTRDDGGVALEAAGLDRAQARTGLEEHVAGLVAVASGTSGPVGAAKEKK